jgi:predicted transposase YdaD
MDMQSKLVHAKRVGEQKGLLKGIQKGRQEVRQEINDLLKSGKSPEEIIKGFST